MYRQKKNMTEWIDRMTDMIEWIDRMTDMTVGKQKT